MVRRGDMMSVDDVMDILSVPVIGTVPDDEDIVISTNQGEPLVGMNGYAGQAYLKHMQTNTWRIGTIYTA